MMIVGDVAIAIADRFQFLGFDDLSHKPLCINLEGAVLPPSVPSPEWGVYNSEAFLTSLERFNLGPIFLANNHIQDLPNGIPSTVNWLRSMGLKNFGVTFEESCPRLPAMCFSDTDCFFLLGFGWPVIGCKRARKGCSGVNILEGQAVEQQLKTAIQFDKEAKTVVIIHGNYEFEPYPQPGHRKLAKILIDSGAYAVIFHHPHIVGPVESYNGRTIAYSLGNWAFSYGKFFGGKLKFPSESFHQIAVELCDGGDKVHHAMFEPPTTVQYVRSELVGTSDFSLKPEFEGFDDMQYLQWFKKNRVKRKGLPIYHSADTSLTNSARDLWVGTRQMMVDFGAKSGLKKMRG